MNIDTQKLYENFDIDNNKQFSNLGITSCNVLSSTDNLISNTGFFLLLIIIAIFVIIFILFCTKGYNSLEHKTDEIINKKFGNEKKKTNINTNANVKGKIHELT